MIWVLLVSVFILTISQIVQALWISELNRRIERLQLARIMQAFNQ